MGTSYYTGGFSDYSYSEPLYQVKWSCVQNVMAILNRNYRIGGIVFYYNVADKTCDVHQSVNERQRARPSNSQLRRASWLQRNDNNWAQWAANSDARTLYRQSFQLLLLKTKTYHWLLNSLAEKNAGEWRGGAWLLLVERSHLMKPSHPW